jgi:hypothetical protein
MKKMQMNYYKNLPLESAQVHFSFISKQNAHFVTEATIRSVFSTFGELINISIKKSEIDRVMGEQHGYGFVHFPLTDAGIQSALKASQSLTQAYVQNVLYDCCLTWSLENFLQQRNAPKPPTPEQPPLQRLEIPRPFYEVPQNNYHNAAPFRQTNNSPVEKNNLTTIDNNRFHQNNYFPSNAYYGSSPTLSSSSAASYGSSSSSSNASLPPVGSTLSSSFSSSFGIASTNNYPVAASPRSHSFFSELLK